MWRNRPLVALAWRLPLAGAGLAALVAGLIFAATADDSTAAPPLPFLETPDTARPASGQQSPGVTATPSATPSPSVTGPTATERSATGTPAASTVEAATVATATVERADGSTTTEAPSTATPPAATETPVPTPPPSSSPPTAVSDLPAFRDTEVLARAAGATLPSGRTFRECVESAPEGHRWPVPVHLYYLGKGEWIVETHVSEIQVIFTEATATFRVTRYEAVGPAC